MDCAGPPMESSKRMIGRLIVTQGGVARELLSAACTILGECPRFEALSLDWSDGFEAAKAKIRTAIDRLDEGQGVLVLTDMFGGTPCNVALTFLEPGKVEVLSGVNLPIVLRLACQGTDAMTLDEIAHWLQIKGQRSVCLASDILNSKECGNNAEVKGAAGPANGRA